MPGGLRPSAISLTHGSGPWVDEMARQEERERVNDSGLDAAAVALLQRHGLPGEAVSAVAVLQGARPSEMRLRWPLLDVGGARVGHLDYRDGGPPQNRWTPRGERQAFAVGAEQLTETGDPPHRMVLVPDGGFAYLAATLAVLSCDELADVPVVGFVCTHTAGPRKADLLGLLAQWARRAVLFADTTGDGLDQYDLSAPERVCGLMDAWDAAGAEPAVAVGLRGGLCGALGRVGPETLGASLAAAIRDGAQATDGIAEIAD